MNRNEGGRHGRDEDDRMSLPEKAEMGLWLVRYWVTSASRLGMPGVGGERRMVMVMGVQR